MPADSNQETLNFIEDYKGYPVLWDSTDKFYSNKQMRKDAIEQLGTKYKLSEISVKNKIKSLRSYFSKEHQKTIKKKSGSGADEGFTSNWFAYKALLFIKDSVTPKETTESGLEVSTNDISDENSTASTSTPPIIEIEKKIVTDGFRTPKQRKVTPVDCEVEEAYTFMKKAAAALTYKNECTTFGDMVGIKLKKLNPRNRAIAQNQIKILIFELEMEEMAQSTSTPMFLSAETSVLTPVESVSSPTNLTTLQLVYPKETSDPANFRELFSSTGYN